MTTQTTGSSEIAERYATALFELALEREELDSIKSDLDSLASLLNKSEDLNRLTRSPVISRKEQGKAIDSIAENLKISLLVRNFLGVMANKRRLFALEAVIRNFHHKVAEHKGEVAAQVTSAQPLKPEHEAAVRVALKDFVGRDVALETIVDPAIIGGLKIMVGSRMIDNSIRTKLDNIELAMKGI